MSSQRARTSILDKPLSRGKGEVSLSCFALLFSEVVQYSQSRVYTVPELQNRWRIVLQSTKKRKKFDLDGNFHFRLHELGMDVGSRLIDLYFVREQNSKRETKLINMLLFVKTTLWKCLFGKEAEKLEHANDDDRTYYIIEKEPLVNKFISVPKDKGSLNCATFTAGLVEAVLTNCGFVSSIRLEIFRFVFR